MGTAGSGDDPVYVRLWHPDCAGLFRDCVYLVWVVEGDRQESSGGAGRPHSLLGVARIFRALSRGMGNCGWCWAAVCAGASTDPVFVLASDGRNLPGVGGKA